MMLVPVVVRENGDGAIKTQRHGLIVQNRVCPTKNIKICVAPSGWGLGGRGTGSQASSKLWSNSAKEGFAV